MHKRPLLTQGHYRVLSWSKETWKIPKMFLPSEPSAAAAFSGDVCGSPAVLITLPNWQSSRTGNCFLSAAEHVMQKHQHSIKLRTTSNVSQNRNLKQAEKMRFSWQMHLAFRTFSPSPCADSALIFSHSFGKGKTILSVSKSQTSWIGNICGTQLGSFTDKLHCYVTPKGPSAGFAKSRMKRCIPFCGLCFKHGFVCRTIRCMWRVCELTATIRSVQRFRDPGEYNPFLSPCTIRIANRTCQSFQVVQIFWKRRICAETARTLKMLTSLTKICRVTVVQKKSSFSGHGCESVRKTCCAASGSCAKRTLLELDIFATSCCPSFFWGGERLGSDLWFGVGEGRGKNPSSNAFQYKYIDALAYWQPTTKKEKGPDCITCTKRVSMTVQKLRTCQFVFILCYKNLG